MGAPRGGTGVCGTLRCQRTHRLVWSVHGDASLSLRLGFTKKKPGQVHLLPRGLNPQKKGEPGVDRMRGSRHHSGTLSGGMPSLRLFRANWTHVSFGLSGSGTSLVNDELISYRTVVYWIFQGQNLLETCDYLIATYGAIQQIAPDAPLWPGYSNNSRGRAIGYTTLRAICARQLGTTEFHTLRHTFTELMGEAGASLEEKQATLLHVRPDPTQIYARKLHGQANRHAGSIALRITASPS